MSTLINPATDRSFRHEHLLSCLMEWSTEKRILSAVLKAGRADMRGLVQMAYRVKETLDGRGRTGLSEAEVARYLAIFLEDRKVRRVIAGYVSQAHGRTKREATRELWGMRSELREIAGLERPGIVLVGGGN